MIAQLGTQATVLHKIVDADANILANGRQLSNEYYPAIGEKHLR